MSTQSKLELPTGRSARREQSLARFARTILELNKQASQLMSSRGWSYFLEGFNLITKGEFDKVQSAINECRKKGYLPIDFVETDKKRAWNGVEDPTPVTPERYMKQFLEATLNSEEYYTPDWWDGEGYYIQMMVEKSDLVNMFKPICEKYHIPIVNAGGWYDISERGEAVERFKDAEDNGLTPIILYFGDFDPFGLAISNFLKHNFEEIERGTGWSPANLEVKRFGLNFDFIQDNNLTWIDNLESGAGRDMSVHMQDNRIVSDYISKYGVRKCEANAIMRASVRPVALQLCEDSIQEYLGSDAEDRFEQKRQTIRDRLEGFREQTGLQKALEEAMKLIE